MKANIKKPHSGGFKLFGLTRGTPTSAPQSRTLVRTRLNKPVPIISGFFGTDPSWLHGMNRIRVLRACRRQKFSKDPQGGQDYMSAGKHEKLSSPSLLNTQSPKSVETLPSAPMLRTTEVASFLRIRNRSTFWLTVRRQGIPHIRVSSKKILFPRAAFMLWLKKRCSFEHHRYPIVGLEAS